MPSTTRGDHQQRLLEIVASSYDKKNLQKQRYTLNLASAVSDSSGKGTIAANALQSGRSAVSRGKYEDAISYFNEAVSYSPDYLSYVKNELPNAYFLYGKQFYDANNFDKARENFENAIKWNNTNSEKYNRVDVINKVYIPVERSMTNSEYHTWLAKSLYKLKNRNEAAISNLNSALELNDKNIEAYYYLGQVYFFGMNDTANAVIYWKKSMELGNQQGKQNYEWWLKLQK